MELEEMTTPLPNTLLLYFILDRLQKYVWLLIKLIFSLYIPAWLFLLSMLIYLVVFIFINQLQQRYVWSFLRTCWSWRGVSFILLNKFEFNVKRVEEDIIENPMDFFNVSIIKYLHSLCFYYSCQIIAIL